MKKKLSLIFIALTLSLASCSQSILTSTSIDTPAVVPTNISAQEPTTTPEVLESTHTAIPSLSPTEPAPLTSIAPDNIVQVGMFRLIPAGFLSAGYCDAKTIREEPDLKSVFETVSGGCSLSGEPDEVDALMGVSVMPSAPDSLGITLPIVTIRRGNFDRETIAKQLQEDYAGALFLEYQGIELTVIEAEKGLRLASAFIDESTWVFGPEEVVMAVIDTAQGLTTPLLADLGAALPRVFWAAIWARCDYEAQGCTASVSVGLAKGTEGTISMIQFYQFENAEMAADALPVIRTQQEESNSWFGSVKIVGDAITQEERFVKVEGTVPLEDLIRMFE